MKKQRCIWLVTIGEPLPIEPDSRALRCRILAQRLANRGHKVVWWTSDFNHFSKLPHPVDEMGASSEEGYELRFLHGRPYKTNLSFARQRNHIELARDFAEKAKSEPLPDIVVCSFPPIELADVASQFANANDVPFLLDIRDLWPDEITVRFPRALQPLAKIAVLPLRWKVKSSLRRSSAIIGVSRTYLDWGLNQANRLQRDFDRVIPLGYADTPASRSIRQQRLAADPAKDVTCRFLFSGSFNQSVDVGLVIEAFRRMPHFDMSVVICGTGEMEKTWRKEASGDSRITFTGWVGSKEICANAAEADVGIICYKAQSLVAMPNKLFEYLSFGLPVLNSIPGEVEDIVNSARIGWNYKAGSIQSLCSALSLSIEAKKRDRLPHAEVIDLFERNFSSDNVYARYVDLIERIMNSK